MSENGFFQQFKLFMISWLHERAARFEVSARTIYRDIDALSGAGIPVYSEAGRGGGICLMNHFVLDRAVLTEAEKQDILSALQSVAAAGNRGGEATLEKLSALFQSSGAVARPLSRR